MTGSNEPDVAAMAEHWLNLKAQIKSLTEDLHRLEGSMLPFVETKAYGQATTFAGDCKITVRMATNYTVDVEVLRDLSRGMSAEMIPVKTKVEADPGRIRYLQLNEPRTWAHLSEAFTGKPAKPGFRIEKFEEDY